MKRHSPAVTPMLVLLAMAAVILDSGGAARSVREALSLCLETVIPGLFPLFVLGAMAVPLLAELPFPPGLHRLLGIPRGCEGLFLLGAVGGFPLGAQCIAQAVRSGGLSRKAGERMLGFCSNCGISFLFGILPALFVSIRAPILCFLVQLESAFLIAVLWPGGDRGKSPFRSTACSLAQSVPKAIGSMALVCGWILLAAVLRGFLEQWLFPFLPPTVCLLTSGFLELTGGCLGLSALPSQELRFLLCCGFVCFGGVTVLLQIRAVGAAADLSIGVCVAQKLTQALVGMLLALGILRFGAVFLLLPVFFLPAVKKHWLFPAPWGIIKERRREGAQNVISQKNAESL